MNTVVLNLGTSGHEEQIYSCPPREAVIAAYAQSRRDFNTWDYEQRYGSLVEEGHVTVMCGDFAAWKDENQTNAERLKIIRESVHTSQLDR
jgi:hypothetical protein